MKKPANLVKRGRSRDSDIKSSLLGSPLSYEMAARYSETEKTRAMTPKGRKTVVL